LRLSQYLALAYLVLIIYASLYPFANWRDLGVSPLEFIDAAWPRYWTVFDLMVKVLAYLPCRWAFFWRRWRYADCPAGAGPQPSSRYCSAAC